MGFDQLLYAKFYVRDRASKSIFKDGSPVDIPLSADPSCGIRHFDNVKYIMSEVIYWRNNRGVHNFIQNHMERCFPDIDADIHIPVATIVDLRDELIKLSKGENSELTEEFDCYILDNGDIDKESAMNDAKTLDDYIHMGDKVSFVYTFG